MNTDRRGFLKLAGVAGAGLMAVGEAAGKDAAAPVASSQADAKETAFTTELFLDNNMIEVTPGVSRRLHPPKKHLLNPVVRCDRWCEGNNIQPYTTMYDKEDKLFKMWARTGSDWKSRVFGRSCGLHALFHLDRWRPLGQAGPRLDEYRGSARPQYHLHQRHGCGDGHREFPGQEGIRRADVSR